jgi:hypothetical protein
VAFLKNRITFIVFMGLIILAAIGLLSKLITDPAGFFTGIAITILTGAVILIVVLRFYKPSPEKREQRAFVRAAKKSIKRHKDTTSSITGRKASKSNVKPLKKAKAVRSKSNLHLTVIEGKKGKKKNRASF